jgi:hypothetical protein
MSFLMNRDAAADRTARDGGKITIVEGVSQKYSIYYRE